MSDSSPYNVPGPGCCVTWMGLNGAAPCPQPRGEVGKLGEAVVLQHCLALGGTGAQLGLFGLLAPLSIPMIRDGSVVHPIAGRLIEDLDNRLVSSPQATACSYSKIPASLCGCEPSAQSFLGVEVFTCAVTQAKGLAAASQCAPTPTLSTGCSCHHSTVSGAQESCSVPVSPCWPRFCQSWVQRCQLALVGCCHCPILVALCHHS